MLSWHHQQRGEIGSILPDWAWIECRKTHTAYIHQSDRPWNSKSQCLFLVTGLISINWWINYDTLGSLGFAESPGPRRCSSEGGSVQEAVGSEAWMSPYWDVEMKFGHRSKISVWMVNIRANLSEVGLHCLTNPSAEEMGNQPACWLKPSILEVFDGKIYRKPTYMFGENNGFQWMLPAIHVRNFPCPSFLGTWLIPGTRSAWPERVWCNPCRAWTLAEATPQQGPPRQSFGDDVLQKWGIFLRGMC